MSIEPFYLIITDGDQQLFNIVGPISDDTKWNDRVVAEQEKGRKVNCQSANQALSKELLINRLKMQLAGYKFSETMVL